MECGITKRHCFMLVKRTDPTSRKKKKRARTFVEYFRNIVPTGNSVSAIIEPADHDTVSKFLTTHWFLELDNRKIAILNGDLVHRPNYRYAAAKSLCLATVVDPLGCVQVRSMRYIALVEVQRIPKRRSLILTQVAFIFTAKRHYFLEIS